MRGSVITLLALRSRRAFQPHGAHECSLSSSHRATGALALLIERALLLQEYTARVGQCIANAADGEAGAALRSCVTSVAEALGGDEFALKPQAGEADAARKVAVKQVRRGDHADLEVLGRRKGISCMQRRATRLTTRRMQSARRTAVFLSLFSLL